MQGSRPDRIGDQIRSELSEILAREVKDPGVGFVTLTRVRVTPDLSLARVYYTSLGDDAARAATGKALGRAGSFLRRAVSGRLRLRRAPALEFVYDESIEGQDRMERLLREIREQGAREQDACAQDPQNGPVADEEAPDGPERR